MGVPIRHCRGAPTLGAFADAWVEGLKLADSTIAGYKKIIRNHLRPQLGHYPLDKLIPTRIARHYRELEQHGRTDEQDKGGPLSANTVHKAHVVLGAILHAAIEDGHLATNPAKRKAAKAPTAVRMRAEKPERVTWTTDRLAAFLAWDRDEIQDELFALWWVSCSSAPVLPCAQFSQTVYADRRGGLLVTRANPGQERSESARELIRGLHMRLVPRPGDDVELRTGDALRELPGCRKVRAILGAAQHERRHGDRGESGREINTTHCPQHREHHVFRCALLLEHG